MRQLQTLYSASGPAALFFYFFLFIRGEGGGRFEPVAFFHEQLHGLPQGKHDENSACTVSTSSGAF